ncbi:DUF2863 family protein [Candidimonas humi]|jgi:hypothetical protein|uniref:DUF2863 family protein n=1 Tax=Candidimonas humi TaxID=683355 RepID=A0ABV8P3H1_9BURK|nr:DUF2863 family protein [Candidimonas humi]MBV6306477.1 DUF2863 family protein [Candidimonas humi]
MPRTSDLAPTAKPTREAQQLVTLAQALALSGSRLEDAYWENLLAGHVSKLLQSKRNRSVESALDHLAAHDLPAYEILVEQAETSSESTRIEADGVEYDALLFSAPIVAWTRYRLPDGRLAADLKQTLQAQLQQHIVAEGARLAILPELVSFDQMPQSFQDTWNWTRRLGLAALGQGRETSLLKAPPDSEGMLADARFIVGAIVVPKGAALFRWQSQAEPVSRGQCLERWAADSSAALGPLFTGCQFDYVQPDAFYISNREADRRIRPLALKAAVAWLSSAAGIEAADLRAVIAGCGETQVEEYRIGFGTRQSSEVVYGCIWPILSKDEAAAESEDGGRIDIPDEIAAELKELGVADIRRLPGLYPAEFCEDCGAPYFPNALGEMMHPEVPEEADLGPAHFH